MVILQTDLAHEAIQQTFSIDPSTVYGVFAGVLLFIIIVLAIAGYRIGTWAGRQAEKLPDKFIKSADDKWNEWTEGHKSELAQQAKEREQDRQDRIKENAERAERDRRLLDAIASMSAITETLKQRIDGLDRRMERLEDKV